MSSEPARVRPTVSLLDYQQEDVEAGDRFRWNCWARQTGKSFTKSLRRVLRGLQRERNQIFLSAGLRQSRELMEKASQHCQALKIAFDTQGFTAFDHLNLGKIEIRLPRGVRLIALPANPLTIRGYTGDLLLDEFAMHANDREIWAAMLPTLMRDRGEVDVASTPKGRSNLFYELRENPLFATSFLTLPEAISRGLEVNAEQMRAAIGDEELYRQEFLCEFLDEATAFLTYEQITGCTDATLVVHHEVGPLANENRELFAGVDVGRVRDLTAIWVFAGQPKQAMAQNKGTVPAGAGPTLFTAGLIELAGQSFGTQFDVISELLHLRQLRHCCIDSGGMGMPLGEQLVERFGAHRITPIVFTAALKSQLAGALRVAVENRRIRIPPDDRIRDDWHSVERSMTESGLFRLSAPRQKGSHADRFWAAALALHAAGQSPGAVEYRPGKSVSFARKGAW